MEITNAKYFLDEMSNQNISINCIIDGEHHSVPLKVGNRHYDEIMRQVDAGTLTIADAE
tara:strand:+ start:168 stop:344 length:177 start_codon:yes stop_codon:yes gene_type:complete